MFATKAGGAAKLRLQHRIAHASQQLHFGVEAPAVARPWATVDQRNQGQRFGLAAFG